MIKGFLSEQVFAEGPWDYFEKAIARYFIHKGWRNVELVGGTGDKGADVLASFNGTDNVIQVKFQSTNKDLSVDIVGDTIKAMDYYKIDRGLCISNRVLGSGQKKKLNVNKASGYDIESFTSGVLLESFENMDKWSEDIRSPYNYQIECLSELKHSYPKDNRGLICLATGMGKTFVACNFIKHIYQKNEDLNILIVAHQESILEQFEKSLWPSLPKTIPTYLLSSGSKTFNFNGGVLLSTFGSFPKWHEINNDVNFDILVVDEAHHSRASTYEKVINMINPIYRLGLTATPFRSDRQSIPKVFGPPLVFYDVAVGIKNNYLCEVDYKLRNDNIDINWISKKSEKGYTIRQLNKKIFIEEKDDKACEIFAEYWKKEKRKRGIIFCQSVKHAMLVEKYMRINQNINTVSITNKNNRRENLKNLREFRIGKIKVVTVFDMLNEGVDVPDVDIIAFMRVTHSRTYFLQQLGRGLRYQRGKKLIVVDFVSDLRRIKSVKRLRDSFYSGSPDNSEDYEFLDLDVGFKLEYSNQNTSEFLDLVVQDVSDEFYEEHDIVKVSI